jgi:prolyl oligopeptidase PreP (S9A serine peptidase family)
VLEDYAILDGADLGTPLVLALFTRDSVSELRLYELSSGAFLAEVPTPGAGTVAGLAEHPDGGPRVWFGYTDFTSPEHALVFDARTGESAVWLGYSPYHHVHQGTGYPATLFAIFDGDTRVDPLHARKLAAALQDATTAGLDERPILVRREENVGHYTRAVSRSIPMWLDQLCFLAGQLGLGGTPGR